MFYKIKYYICKLLDLYAPDDLYRGERDFDGQPMIDGESAVKIKTLAGSGPVWTDPPQEAWEEAAFVGPGIFKNWHWLSAQL